MQHGFRIGRIGPTPLYLSRTWPLGVLIIASLYVSTVAAHLPLGRALPIAASLVAGLFGSVLIHEVCHGLAGHATGRPPVNYTLTLWGGYTAFSRAESRPSVMALTAIAGPAANLALGGILHLAASSLTGDARLIVAMLASMNLILGLFNLAPGLPMDGGHVVHAIAWAARGDRDKGMVTAAWAGRVIAVGLGVAGIVSLATGERSVTSPALWLVFIALFLYSGATRSLSVAHARVSARDVDLRELMSEVPALRPTDPASAIPAGGAVVLDGDRLLGIAMAGPSAEAALGSVGEHLRRLHPDSVLTLWRGPAAVAALGRAASNGDLAVLHDSGRWYLGRIGEIANRLPGPRTH